MIILSIFVKQYAYSQNKNNNQRFKHKTNNVNKADSLLKQRQIKIEAERIKRQFTLDSTRKARKHILDSSIQAHKIAFDKIKAQQKKRTDSLNAIRKYKECKKYKDSIERVRTYKLDSIKSIRKRIFDSTKNARQRIIDSNLKVRKHKSDSIKAIQKQRFDSLNTIRKYRESKRYSDSVKVIRQSRLDSISNARKIINDSLRTARINILDSINNIRKAKLDSLTKSRKERADSLKKISEMRADSFARMRETREKMTKAEQKKKQDNFKLQLGLKMKKKQDAWSNEKMLKKRWTWVRSGFQNMFTRYNYYYNANRKLLEAQANMDRRKKDNYEKLIDLFPFDPNKDSTVFASDMDTIIRKASIGIQIHDPRNKWADDLYYLMGQAYYYRGDFVKAEACFKYLIGLEKTLKNKKNKKQKAEKNGILSSEKNMFFNFLKHKSVYNDAILWLTRTYADNQREEEAEAIIDLLDASEKVSSKMKAKIALEKANLKIREEQYDLASIELSKALKSKAVDIKTRQRASFLSAQLYSQQQQHDSAVVYYKKNIKINPALEMDFYAHKYWAEENISANTNTDKALSKLKSILKDNKYMPYHEQVYYLLGNLAANSHNEKEALNYLYKGIKQTKSSNKQKALSYASIGNIYYNTKQYNNAKKAYDSSSYFAKNIKDNPSINVAIKRSSLLGRIVEPYNVLTYSDSLLKLSQMSEKDQKEVIKKYLKLLEKNKEDSIFNVQNPSNGGNTLANMSGNNNTNANWYFSNSNSVQQGYNEFKRKWGNRPLVDNWRRSNNASISINGNNNTSNSTTSDEEEVEDNQQGPTEKSLLAAIPKTSKEIDKLKDDIQNAYINISKVYINDLNEYKEGIATLDSLNTIYPNHNYKDAELNIRYLAAIQQGQFEKSEKLRQQLLSSYPDSKYAKTLGDNDDLELQKEAQKNVSQYYDETYNMAMEKKYSEALERSKVAQKVYTNEVYIRRFKVLEAIAQIGLGEYLKADTLVKAYLTDNKSDSLKPWIEAIQRFIVDLKIADTGKIKIKANNASTDTIVNNVGIKSIVKSETAATIDTSYKYTANTPHFCLFVLEEDESKILGFKAGIEDFSRIKFSGLALTFNEGLISKNQFYILVQSFKSSSEAKIFMKNILKEKELFRELNPKEYQTYIISENNFNTLKASQNLKGYIHFYNKNYK